MKYAKEIYEYSEFYGADEDIVNHKQKIVKIRKQQMCCQCEKSVEVGDNALCETGFMDSAPVRAYTCINCCDKWIAEIEGEEAE